MLVLSVSFCRAGGAPPGAPRPPGRGAPNTGGGGGAGDGGGAERLHDAHLQQQIVVALRRLREDMRSVMERLEAVEHLAAAHVSSAPRVTLALNR